MHADDESPWEPLEGGPVEIPLEDFMDLHPFAPEDIPSVAEAYLEAAREAGLQEVRLIHGRGRGVQKERVRQLLGRLDWVEHFEEAPAERGGWGATLVWLRRSGSGGGGENPGKPQADGGHERDE